MHTSPSLKFNGDEHCKNFSLLFFPSNSRVMPGASLKLSTASVVQIIGLIFEVQFFEDILKKHVPDWLSIHLNLVNLFATETCTVIILSCV
jgi:hypothetical protein